MRTRSSKKRKGLPAGIEPYDWALKQLRIAQAHKVTRGSREIVVAVIDLGYNDHPDHRGHLWVNPRPKGGAKHGWDCHDNDASLEDNFYDPPTAYSKGHHAFVVGEVIACAPRCPVMIVRVGYGNNESWADGIDWAVQHGAKVLVIPHGYLPPTGTDGPLKFERGLDFVYPSENLRLRHAIEAAHDAGCLIVRGTADNRGRRVSFPFAALDSVMAVGSTNRRDEPADICADADYVAVGAPGGERHSGDPRDLVWGTGGDRDYISFSGGCMAAGFGGGVAALVWSQFPGLANEQLRQVLRNTARGDGWGSRLGHGILDAGKACRLKEEQLSQRLDIKRGSFRRVSRKRLRVTVINRGAFDVKQAMVVVYNADPRKTPLRSPAELVTCQIGHAMAPVCGLGEQSLEISLSLETNCPGVFVNAAPLPSVSDPIWLELYVLDHGASSGAKVLKLSAATGTPPA